MATRQRDGSSIATIRVKFHRNATLDPCLNRRGSFCWGGFKGDLAKNEVQQETMLGESMKRTLPLAGLKRAPLSQLRYGTVFQMRGGIYVRVNADEDQYPGSALKLEHPLSLRLERNSATPVLPISEGLTHVRFEANEDVRDPLTAGVILVTDESALLVTPLEAWGGRELVYVDLATWAVLRDHPHQYHAIASWSLIVREGAREEVLFDSQLHTED